MESLTATEMAEVFWPVLQTNPDPPLAVRVMVEPEQPISSGPALAITEKKILIITEAWCGDASHLVPVFCKLTELNPNFETRLVYRDENLALMEQFLTNGAKSIPIIIVMDEAYNLVFSWGPRPLEMQKRVTEYKKNPDRAYDDFLNETQVWYNKDKGKSAIIELQNEFAELV